MLYEKGMKKLQNELNVLTILQTMQKFKAALSVLIDDSKLETLTLIKLLYLNNASIYQDKSEKMEFKQSKNEFMKFIERDDRDALRYE